MRGFVALGPALRHLQGFAQGLVHIQGLAQLLVQGLVVAVGAGVCSGGWSRSPAEDVLCKCAGVESAAWEDGRASPPGFSLPWSIAV